jgi:hypothetical protein
MKKKLLTIASMSTGLILFGQSSVNAAGGSVSNDSGSVSYSIGQVAFVSASNSSGSVHQGVQYAFEISILDVEDKSLNLSLNVFPNPTQSKLNLRVGNLQEGKLSYQLLGLDGKVLSKETLETEETLIDMQQLPSAAYFVEVQLDSKKVQTFKIIKNQ